MSQIKTLRDNSKSVFGKISEADMKRQMDTLKYIELVAMQANINLSDINILEMFKANKGSNKLITAPKEINKRLFKMSNETKELVMRANLQEVISKEKLIKANFKRYNAQVGTNLEKDLAEHKRSLKDAEDRQDGYRVAHYKRTVEHIEKKIGSGIGPDRLYKDIGRVVLNGFWKFIGSKGTKLHFITTNNIVLFDKNVRTKMNLQKDFGTFLCKVDIRTLQASIHCWKGNTTLSRDYIHPYVSCGGICYGNASDAIANALQERDLYTVMNIVGMVIGTYNGSEGPHIALVSFINESRPTSFIEMTAEARKYYAQLQPVKDPLKEFMQEVGELKKVGNKLAKSIGNKPEDAADTTHDDEEHEEEFDDEYEEDEDEEYEEEDHT